MTQAEEISNLFGDDGQVWKTRDGDYLDEICRAMLGVRIDHGPHGDHSDIERFTFADGSVITIAGDGWDFGFADCFCWQGAGHGHYCTASRGAGEEA